MLFLLLFLVADAAGAGSASGPRRVVVIDKATRELSVLRDARRVARFPVSFGLDPVSDKRRVHDLATPEGLYAITHRTSRTRFHRSLGLSYPNLADAQRGLAEGIVSEAAYRRVAAAVAKGRAAPCDTGLGCAIAIHGGGVYRREGADFARDWTEGCIALEDADMEELFRLCRTGDPVLILKSDRNLFGLLRPFTEARDTDEDGLPVCPDGLCSYETTVRTWLGAATATLTEGARVSIEVVVNGGGQGGPVLVIKDRNGDGEMSFLDSVEGEMADPASPDSAYGLAWGAIVTALSSGKIPRREGGRPLAVFPRLD
jgi:hypothetical protein